MKKVSIDLSDIHTKTELLDVFNETLQFPDYFHSNWASFEDCMQDLSWLPQNTKVEIDVSSLNLDLICEDAVAKEILIGIHKYWATRNSLVTIKG